MISTEVLEYTLVNSFAVSWELSPFLARTVIGVEYFLGAFLILQLFLRRFTLPALFVLMFLFTIYVSYTIISGTEESCNCLGDFIQLSPAESLIKNVVILIVLFFIYYLSTATKNKLHHKYIITGITLFTLSAPYIFYPMESAATSKYSSTENNKLQLDSLYSNSDTLQIPLADFRKGKHIVAFLSLRCSHCRKAALKLSTMYKRNPGLPIYFILNGKQQYLEDFYEFTRCQKVPQNFVKGRNFVVLAGVELPKIMLIEDGIEIQSLEYPELNQEMLEKWSGSISY